MKKEGLEPPVLSDFLSYMLGRIKKLAEKVASDIMIPRVDVTTLYIGQPLEEVVEIIKEQGFSRFPVWKDKLDNIVGILYVKDLLYQMENGEKGLALREKEISENMLRKSFYIPESKKIESLLKEFQSKKVHLAVVLDEYGGFSGIVTLEDIIEVITGDIQDEYDFETADIRKIDDNSYEIDARASLEELEEELKLDFSEYTEEIDTLGGLIYNTLERVPRIGESIEINGVSYQIVRKEGNKILSIKAVIPPSYSEKNE
jgi:CBS domain containing-hemolysin-like protein